MSNPRHLAMLLQGADAWNAWRDAAPEPSPDPQDLDATVENDASIVDLSGADLRGLDLCGAALGGVTLRAANLSDTDLRNCDLTDSDLVLCDLSGANLGGARLDGADLSGARLEGAWLQHADLGGVLGLTSGQLAQAFYGDRTRLPPYLDAPADEDDPVHFSFDAEEELASLTTIDIYDLLGTPPDAPVEEVRKAFRNLAKKYHPDVNPGDANAERRFAQITEAYRFALAAANARTQIDKQRHSGGWTVSVVLAVLALALPVLGVYWFRGDLIESAPLAKSDLVTSAVAEREARPDAGDALPLPQSGSAQLPVLPTVAAVEQDDAPAESAGTPSVALLEQTVQQMRAEPPADPAAPAQEPAPAQPASAVTPVPPAAETNPPAEPAATVQAAAQVEPSTAVVTAEPATAAPSALPEPDAPAAFSRPWQEEWQSLRSSSDLRALQNYIRRHPDSSEANQARERFRSALTATEDKEALRRVARDLPNDAPETAMVNQRVAALVEKENLQDDTDAWLAAKEARTVAAYRAYLDGFPNGRHIDAARRQLDALQAELRQRRRDDMAWAKAQREMSAAAYEEYLQAFPAGLHADQAELELDRQNRSRVAAQKKKEDDAWAAAKKANTRDAFRAYLKAYPKGRYAAAAKQALAKSAGGEMAATPVPAEPNGSRSRSSAASSRDLRVPASDDPFANVFSNP